MPIRRTHGKFGALDSLALEVGRIQRQQQLDDQIAREQAAQRTLEQRHQFQMADIAQFSGAEAYEKAKAFDKASETYIDLAQLFPQSKYADGALFNAANNYESVYLLSNSKNINVKSGHIDLPSLYVGLSCIPVVRRLSFCPCGLYRVCRCQC